MRAGEAATKTVVWAAERFNPITNSPSAPLKTRSLFASFEPSLMPRAAMHQGMAAGISVLAADLVANAVDASIRRVVPGTAPLSVRLGTRAAVAAAGLAVNRLKDLGDFNVEIDYAEMLPGTNTIEVRAVDGLGFETIKTIAVDYAAGTTWPLPYSVDWSSADKPDQLHRGLLGSHSLLTAWDGDRLIGLELGADDYIAKPLSMPEVMARVTNLIAARQQMRRQ